MVTGASLPHVTGTRWLWDVNALAAHAKLAEKTLPAPGGSRRESACNQQYIVRDSTPRKRQIHSTNHRNHVYLHVELHVSNLHDNSMHPQ